jgi:hypothetical protein
MVLALPFVVATTLSLNPWGGPAESPIHGFRLN